MAEEPTSYNLQETLTSINSFYKFIIRMHTGDDVDALHQPPEGGWPKIEHKDFHKLGFNDKSIDLLRYLPYFGHGQGSRPEIMSETSPMNWVAVHTIKLVKEYTPDGDAPYTPHIITLAQGERYGYTVRIDTDRGAVIWTKNDGHWPRTAPIGDLDSYADEDDLDSEEEIDDADKWKYGRTFRIKSFFDMCKEQFSSLTWIPRMEEGHQGTVMEANEPGQLSDNMAQRAAIMRGAGWLGIGWDKEKAVRETTEKIHYYS